MLHFPTESPPSGASQSPSPEIPSDGQSSNASPVSAPTPSLYMTPTPEDATAPDQRSARSTPTRPASELQRTHSAGKGGCWTCRVRRKKCDEEREGDSCKTCIRLGISCLGWGPKRPEWMRDKEKVAAYKASIKEQLTRAGLIRGQPRAAYMNPGSSVLSSPQPPAVAGPGPQSMRYHTAAGVDLAYRRSGYGGTSQYHRASNAIRPVSGAVSADARNDPHSRHNMAMGSFHNTTMTDPLLQGYSYSADSPPLSMSSTDASPTFGAFFAGSGYDAIPQGLTMAQPMPSPTMNEDYINYYFKYVRKVQYPFAGNTLTNTLYSIIVSDIGGAASNAICALASLHSFRRRVAQGLDAQEHIHTNFYNQAIAQLNSIKSLVGHYSETDAVAAVHLVAFSCLSGLGTWESVLGVAYDWLAQTGIYEEENPKLILMNMSPTGRFAAKATMWIDVLAGITFMQPPRFLPLYHRLWAGGAGFWANPQHQQADIRMDMLTGCPDEAMLAIAEVSALGHWKTTELRNGSLSTRELIRRGDVIEQRLKQRAGPRQFLEIDQAPLDQHLSAMITAVPEAGGLPSPALVHDAGPTAEAARRQIVEIYREAALLYLHTVLSESLPAVPEIASSVATLATLVHDLPVSDLDRAIMFPLFLLGCMTDQPVLQDTVKSRLARLQSNDLGNSTCALTSLESIWNDRRTRAGGVTVDWREYLRQQWIFLLL
ncbi:hypothetical protein CERSUDRAFT_86751 [Gelatoporia subvermispora B]|uniref:Zn(2)-C6 fungal-type domain-containing protein n=1 Tax=Ceriporiopsis subvermispora (strain B) TaxID=914234 RepID=M2R518_CERS8|nr:hypothetical protein CERSUDRAFT_86751 [Gelatoporia subvermispora B]